MKAKYIIGALGLAVCGLGLSAEDMQPTAGPYNANWESLKSWECPEWFKDAKFGIWAHWGPQCEPEAGDWYGRHMYFPGHSQYNYHVSHYGSPDKFGLKDICNTWKAQNWNPQELVDLYKSVGAKYFMVLANHHDNMDLWNSPYQEWNSVNIGPKRDLVGEWAKAAEKAGLRLGVSVHASHAWTWLEGSQRFDGKLTKEDGYTLNEGGTEKWWKGMDPQELYAQNHEHSTGWDNSGGIHGQWDWINGASIPDEPYKKKLMNRTLQLVYDYKPDMVYFDDTVLPFYGCDNQWGQDFLASYYNASAAVNDGKAEVVVTGKQLPADIKQSMLWDVERGIPDRMQDDYWQTCTCIGDWHYNKGVYDGNRYKSGATVIRMLVDVVSKNGNLLLSIPVKGDGTIDDKERKVLADIKAWMDINGESIFGTRTWKTFGEGPLAEAVNPMNAQGFNEGQNYTSSDVRFVQKDNTVYATIMAWPEAGDFTIKSFGTIQPTYSGNVTSVKLLGYGDLKFRQDVSGLIVEMAATHPNEIAPVLAITTDGATLSAYEKLSDLIQYTRDMLNDVKSTASYYNTGRYNAAAIANLEKHIAAAEAVTASDPEQTIAATLESLSSRYYSFLTDDKNKGGLNASISKCESNLTKDKLVEKEKFSRETAGSTRFGAPKYWTVENFNIPNGASGTKQGIDGYTGRDCLMLGVWDDRSAAQNCDLANARIYKKITLPQGLYFFGAAYETSYNISDRAYMFVSDEICNTSDIPAKSLAYYNINACPANTAQYHGLWFYLDAEKEVNLGWQVDLASGSDTQEFRADKVALLKLAETSADDMAALKSDVEASLSFFESMPHVIGNTGYYTAAELSGLRAAYNETASADISTKDNLMSAYHGLKYAWQSFQKNRLAVSEKCEAPYDVTSDWLVEATAFTPTEANLDTRFGSPEYWTVENFKIATGADGIKGGLDKYEGTYALMLGVWDDRSANKGGDLSNARIYRKTYFPAGEYFFGAEYNANYNLKEAYMFVADRLVNTKEIPTEAISWCNVTDCGKKNGIKGIHFTVTEPGYKYLGWQADLKTGSTQQEFRAETLSLLSHNDQSGVTEISGYVECDSEPVYYNLNGVRVSEPSAPGLYVKCTGSRHQKIIEK